MSLVIKKLLIANRGEIALRIIKTCQELNIKTVAVYSEVDKNSCFVQQADESFLIGPAPSNQSYLKIENIIGVAKKAKVDAIHPGYGFLSERAEFSKACEENDIIFLGPKPHAIEVMGDKVAAREVAKKAKVPLVPGTMEPLKDLAKIKKIAKDYTYPVLLKAAAGGGGKGMRVVNDESEIESAFSQASSEALKSFADDRVYLEKYITNPRHVEVQIARDQYGNCLALFERECSLQRRHQKVIEEAPCVYLKESVRKKMFAAATGLANRIEYTGVGTIEFLLDEKQNFYFLEMNTRLQVEHPVTELILGLDLVHMQIQIAQGERLNLSQKELKSKGHAIECRIYAEDPEQNFMPCPGIIDWMNVPEGIGIRHDAGVNAGSEISIYYDPMVAKLIVFAATRELAIKKMCLALKEYKLGGVKTNIRFLLKLLQHDDFVNFTIHTQYIDNHPELLVFNKNQTILNMSLALAVFESAISDNDKTETNVESDVSDWWTAGQIEKTENEFIS
ncbi:hypothetical protein BVY03_00450 [bacterium K02(2017)]|nr:hypothetical protein BVY03_00450 [bacterium K02(2017)]